MKEAVAGITIALLILNMTIQLVAIAKDISVKTIDYANKMNKAIDCAFQGLPIERCLNNSIKQDNVYFENELNNYYNTLDNYYKKLNE